MLKRREFIVMSSFAVPALFRAEKLRFESLPATLAALEKDRGGRLGVAVLDTATGERSGFRTDERFPMCSTFKFLLATEILQRVDRKEESLARAIAIPAKPLLSNSPLTEPHAGESMTVADLCCAVLTRSDNTAANLLLKTVGGPEGLTAFARLIGDGVFRLDRWELALNEAIAGDPRDTTSPAAMITDLRSVLLGDVLSEESRKQLTTWMAANLTGLTQLRAGFPQDWQCADKTGSNGAHTTNDIAVLWPPRRAPIVIAAYITQCPGPESKRRAMLAEIGRLVRQGLDQNLKDSPMQNR